MAQSPKTIAAHVNSDTEPLWSRFLERSRALGLTNSRALAQAAEMWLAHTVPDPWQAPLHAPVRFVWSRAARDRIAVFASSGLDGIEWVDCIEDLEELDA